MSFGAGAMTAADPRMAGVTARRGLGFHRLQFSLALEMRTYPDHVFELSNLTGQVSAGISQSGPFLPLGRVAPETSWFAETTTYSRTDHLVLFLDLTSEQLEALERLRGGASLVFEFDFRVQVRTGGKNYPGFETVRFEATLSDWSRILQELGYLELLVLAVELPIGAPEAHKNAIAQMRGAQQDLIAGRYDSAVARCRLAMDTLEVVVPCETATDELRRAFATKESREGMAKPARAGLVRAAVRHYTHLAHHVDSSGAPESFSRQDALFILAATAGTIWEAITELQRRA